MAVVKKLGEILLELGYLNKEQLEVALNVKKTSTKMIGEVFQELDFVTSSEIAQAIAEQENLKFTNIFDEKIDENLLKKIPKVLCETHFIFPLREEEDGTIIIIKHHEADLYLDDYIKQYTNSKKIIYYISDKKTIHKAINIYYKDTSGDDFDNLIEKLNSNINAEVSIDLLLNKMFADALKRRSSDIHITPELDKFYIFYRIDGVLKHRHSLRKDIYKKFENLLKLKSKLDISTVLSSIDGRFSFEYLDEKFDVRCSFLNLDSVGSNIVLRILAKNNSVFNLTHLGLSKSQNDKLTNYINKPHGIILVTGPTGSGKTTTLYSMLRKVNALQKNILTVEDPIEYKFSFIKQTQVNLEANYDFSDAIRAFMRQDPDVILVGEIRDEKTAELAIRASITGHLVISTLHTNDAVSTIPRLLDLKIKEFLISSSILVIISQRLIRKLCNTCKKEHTYTYEELKNHPLFLNDTKHENYIKDGLKGFNSQGCRFCNDTGYSGREAIIEILEIDKTIQEMIINNRSIIEIEEYARMKGMNSLKESGLDKFFEGKTTLEELMRVIN